MPLANEWKLASYLKEKSVKNCSKLATTVTWPLWCNFFGFSPGIVQWIGDVHIELRWPDASIPRSPSIKFESPESKRGDSGSYRKHVCHNSPAKTLVCQIFPLAFPNSHLEECRPSKHTNFMTLWADSMVHSENCAKCTSSHSRSAGSTPNISLEIGLNRTRRKGQDNQPYKEWILLYISVHKYNLFISLGCNLPSFTQS